MNSETLKLYTARVHHFPQDGGKSDKKLKQKSKKGAY